MSCHSIACCRGPRGFVGPSGATGVQGLVGPVGATGVQGKEGVQGRVGQTGATGVQGLVGVIGATGVQGKVGTAGATGAQGKEGVQGPCCIGPQGPAGSGGGSVTLSGDVTGPSANNTVTKIQNVPVSVAAVSGGVTNNQLILAFPNTSVVQVWGTQSFKSAHDAFNPEILFNYPVPLSERGCITYYCQVSAYVNNSVDNEQGSLLYYLCGQFDYVPGALTLVGDQTFAANGTGIMSGALVFSRVSHTDPNAIQICCISNAFKSFASWTYNIFILPTAASP